MRWKEFEPDIRLDVAASARLSLWYMHLATGHGNPALMLLHWHICSYSTSILQQGMEILALSTPLHQPSHSPVH